MKMKKFILGGLAAAAVIAPIALTAGSASAATTDANGVVTVTKGDIQSAMGWNNAEWEQLPRHQRRRRDAASSSPPARQHADRP